MNSLNCHRYCCKLLDDRNNIADDKYSMCKCHVPNDGIAHVAFTFLSENGNVSFTGEWGNISDEFEISFYDLLF